MAARTREAREEVRGGRTRRIASAVLGATLLASSVPLGCATDHYGRPIVTQNQMLGAAAGGLAGAAIGNKVGSRSKETANTIAGGLAGAVLGGWLGGQLDRGQYDRPPRY